MAGGCVGSFDDPPSCPDDALRTAAAVAERIIASSPASGLRLPNVERERVEPLEASAGVRILAQLSQVLIAGQPP
jgi:hypothetical protein